MKNELNIIYTYINTASKGIHDKRIKRELKDELFSHLIEIYERNIALGMSDEDAQKDAVSHMGDSEAVAETFRQLYPISSEQYFKQSAWMVAFPLLFIFSISIRGIDFLYLLTFLLFCSLTRIRKINKTLNAAFITSLISGILQVILFFIQYSILLDRTVNICIALSSQVMYAIIYTLIIVGLIKVKKELEEPKEDFWLAYASIPAMIISIGLAILSEFTLIDYNWSFIGLLFGFLINILPIAVIYTTVKDIDYLETGVPVKFLSRKKIALIFALLFVFSMYFVVSERFISHYPPVEYSVNDTEEDVTETRNNLIEMGLPVNVAYDLPESEILKYKSVTELKIYERDEPYNPLADKAEEDLTQSHYMSYVFTIPETESNPLQMRVLMVVDRFEYFDQTLHTELFIDGYKENTKDVFCKMLCDIDGVSKEIIPIYSGTVSDEYYKDLYYIFTPTENAKNHRAYIAHTITPSTTDEEIWYQHEYAQNTIFEINNPFDKYWLRSTDRYYAVVKNPNYVYPQNKYPSTVTDDELVDFNDYL